MVGGILRQDLSEERLEKGRAQTGVWRQSRDMEGHVSQRGVLGRPRHGGGTGAYGQYLRDPTGTVSQQLRLATDARSVEMGMPLTTPNIPQSRRLVHAPHATAVDARTTERWGTACKADGRPVRDQGSGAQEAAKHQCKAAPKRIDRVDYS